VLVQMLEAVVAVALPPFYTKMEPCWQWPAVVVAVVVAVALVRDWMLLAAIVHRQPFSQVKTVKAKTLHTVAVVEAVQAAVDAVPEMVRC
jgi:hypothetical protein